MVTGSTVPRPTLMTPSMISTADDGEALGRSATRSPVPTMATRRPAMGSRL